MLESTTLDIGIGGSGCKTVAALEDIEGSSSAWADEDDVEITGVDINLFCLGRDESGWKLQSGEACPTDAHLEHVNCPLQAV
ncbi:hypothetical protein TNCV_4328291 [Trichonephila clavipes]|nr:hypothetical protein TNCV_4328291 [Trichonephila clavipes]